MRDCPTMMLAARMFKCLVCIPYSSLPKIGARPLICVPRAALTCCEVSDTKSSILVIISLRSVLRSSSPQNPKIVRNATQRITNGHTRYLPCNSCAYLCLTIFQQFHKGGHEVTGDRLVIYSLGDLFRRSN